MVDPAADEELADLYPDEPVATLPADLRSVLPRDKEDFDRVRRVVDLGYPAVAPILPHLMTWLQDVNWPIAAPIGEYLASLGRPVVPLVRQVLEGDDDIWKHWVLRVVVMAMDPDVARELAPDLQRLAALPNEEDVHLDAAEVLTRLAG
jgi:hypothetical protein